VAEVWVDEEWFAARGEGRCPTVGEPATFPVADGSLIGRRSNSRNIHPDVDCLADGSVSARQALLGFNGTIWTVTDLGSTNGTFIAPAGGPLPSDPIEPNQAVELEAGDRILVGAHTRIVLLPEASGPAAP
jgi:pSer/pThr/pTyr-binding forkhead associated (FHA) protein